MDDTNSGNPSCIPLIVRNIVLRAAGIHYLLLFLTIKVYMMDCRILCRPCRPDVAPCRSCRPCRTHVAPTSEHGFLKNKSENQKSEMQRHSIEQNYIHSLSQIWCAVSLRAVISIRKTNFSLILSFLSIQISLCEKIGTELILKNFVQNLYYFMDDLSICA